MAKVRIEIVANDEASGVFRNLEKRGTSAFDKIRSSAMDFFKAMVGFEAVKQAFRFLKGVATDVLDIAASFEKTEIMLTRLTGSSEKGKEAFDWIVDFSTKTPFRLEAVQDSFVKLQVAGLDPMSGKLENLTDAVAAFGGGSQELQRASVAIQQMSGKGVISMEELRQQLGEAIPSAMKVMAREMGMSMKDFTDAVARGEVDAKTGLEALFKGFEKDFGGAAAGMMKSWTGMMAQLKVEWAKFAKNIMDAGLFETLKDSALDFMTWIKGQDLNAWAQKISSAVEVVISIFKGGITVIKTIIGFSHELGLALLAVAAAKTISGIGSLISAFKKLKIRVALTSLQVQAFAAVGAYYMGEKLGGMIDKLVYKFANIDLSGWNRLNEKLKSISDEREYVERKHAEALERHKQKELEAQAAVEALTLSEQKRSQGLKELSTIMKKMLDLESKIKQQREGYLDLELDLRQKLMTESEKYYSTQDRLEDKLATALQLSGQAKIDALTAYQREVAASARVVKDENENVIVSLADAVESALGHIKTAQDAIQEEQGNMAAAIYAEADAWATLETAADAAIQTALKGINDMSIKLDALTSRPHVINMVIRRQTIGSVTEDSTAPVDQGPEPVDGLATGTPFVPKDGLYKLHRGEEVVPAHKTFSNQTNQTNNFFITNPDVKGVAREVDEILAKRGKHGRSRFAMAVN